MGLLHELFDCYAEVAGLPYKAKQAHPGGWVATEHLRLSGYKYRDDKLLRIMENPLAVLNNEVSQDPVTAVWSPEYKFFVLKNGNHRLRVAAGLRRPLFYIHKIWTRGDMGWQSLLEQVPDNLDSGS